MLHFLRKHQKIFFVFITVMIIFSFTFFGTSQAFTQKQTVKDELAFKTRGGKRIGTHFLSQFCQFLKYEGAGADFGSSNFLNDFVITGEILDGGLAAMIFEQDPEAFKVDLEKKLAREKLYKGYVHPYASQLNADTIWSLFAPELHDQLAALKKVDDASDVDGFKTRVALFMAEKRFPPQMLANMLRYQERDLGRVPADSRLMRGDVALFGYHSLEDWFGPLFVERSAKLIIEGAELAKARGHVVKAQEVTSELLYRSQKAYEGMKEQMKLPVSNGAELMQLYLRQSGLEEAQLVKIYEKVILFRRLLQEVASGVLVDTLPLENFYNVVGERVTVAVEQMPQELRFKTKDELKEFEIYLAALGGDREHPLALPTQIKPANELVGKRYSLYVAEAKRSDLVSRVSVQESWAWEEEHLEMLKEKFSQLKNDHLADLDLKQRAPIDAFARAQIAKMHPEWIDEKVKSAPMNEKELFISSASSRSLLKGISDNVAFKQALDSKDELVGYTQDDEHYYRILVQERADDEVLSFVAAKKEGVIDELSKKFEVDIDDVIGAIARIENVSKDDALAYRFSYQMRQEGDSLEQFKRVSRDLTLTRIEQSFIPYDEIEEQGVGAADGEGAYRYHVVERQVDRSLPLEKIVQAQQMLSKEAKQVFMKKTFFHD